jgi:GNAT superfamily N-acetyltransferase
MGAGMHVIERVEFRDGGPSDLTTVRRILAAANEPFRSVLQPGAFDPYLEMVLALEERLSVASVILAEVEDRTVGTVTYFPDATAEGWGCPAGDAGIRAMGVDPSAQGMGIGAALLGECRRRAIADGAAAIILHTAFFLPAAIRLYERHGFVRDPRFDVRAVDVMELADQALDYPGLAYRLELPR